MVNAKLSNGESLHLSSDGTMGFGILCFGRRHGKKTSRMMQVAPTRQS